jgi:hypothetical protein
VIAVTNVLVHMDQNIGIGASQIWPRRIDILPG